MPTKKLSALAIPNLPPGEWYDSLAPGLVLRVGQNRKTWYCRFYVGGAYKRERLGSYPMLELREARDEARLMIEMADRGLPIRSVPPPQLMAELVDRGLPIRSTPPAPHPRSSHVLTLGDLFDRYEALRKKEGNKIRTLGEAMALLRRALKPYSRSAG